MADPLSDYRRDDGTVKFGSVLVREGPGPALGLFLDASSDNPEYSPETTYPQIPTGGESDPTSTDGITRLLTFLVENADKVALGGVILLAFYLLQPLLGIAENLTEQ